MSVVSRSKASIRLVGDDLIPDEVSRSLQGTPTFSYAKGETLPGGRVPNYGMWNISSSESSPCDLDRQIMSILDDLNPDVSIWMKLSANLHIDCFCGIWLKTANEGFNLSPSTLQALGERGIEIDFDIYTAEMEE